MAAPLTKATVLDFFRAQKHEPIIQFLTWYIVLVHERKIEDIDSVEITPLSVTDPFLDLRSQTRFRFVFHGKAETWTVNQNGRGDFYVASVWSVIDNA